MEREGRRGAHLAAMRTSIVPRKIGDRMAEEEGGDSVIADTASVLARSHAQQDSKAISEKEACHEDLHTYKRERRARG